MKLSFSPVGNHYVSRLFIKSDKDDNLYAGFTNDIRKRILKHNAGKVFSTKYKRPLKLIYCEVCLNEKDAR